ncbi:MAG: hypothetical protein HC852_02820 [Acaryochloridaceae cyanobacterium RU_4_10]|nr:hypothetical protein [Acaryochloridaceae cyanobacterium RU_4_10]
MTNIVVIKDRKKKTFEAELRDGGIWVKTPKGKLPMCDSSKLKSQGLDPVAVAKAGEMHKYPDCWLKLGQNPGGAIVYLAEEYRKIEKAEKEREEAEWLDNRDSTIQSCISACTVKLQRHEYSFPTIEWYLCFGDVQQQIYPEQDISLERSPDETYMAGVRWLLTSKEYQQISAIPTSKPEPQYDLTEPIGTPEGVDKICKAENEWHRAQSAYESAYEREEYAPYPSDKNYRTEIAVHPRAALYLKCEAYIRAENYHKAEAGNQAKDLLVRGGKAADVEAILDNWVHPSAKWD